MPKLRKFMIVWCSFFTAWCVLWFVIDTAQMPRGSWIMVLSATLQFYASVCNIYLLWFWINRR